VNTAPGSKIEGLAKPPIGNRKIKKDSFWTQIDRNFPFVNNN
jgi:hypothetical protein